MNALDVGGRELAEQLAELLPQYQIRLHLLVSLRVDERQVHCVAHLAREQIRRDDFRHLDPALLLRFLRARAEMWSEHHVRQLPQRMFRRQWLLRKNIQRRARHFLRLQRRD